MSSGVLVTALTSAAILWYGREDGSRLGFPQEGRSLKSLRLDGRFWEQQGSGRRPTSVALHVDGHHDGERLRGRVNADPARTGFSR